MKLSRFCEYISKRIDSSTLTVENYISTENMLQNRCGVVPASKIPAEKAVEFLPGDILISNIRPYFKKIWFADKKGGCSSDVLCIRALPGTDSTYLYFLLSQDAFFAYVMTGAKGSKMPRGDKSQIMQWDIDMPDTIKQRHIASILKSIDDKIKLNNRINHNLEEQMISLFDELCVDINDCIKAPLTEIADYVNGLAMQKFPATGGEKGLPVLKIKELGQGFFDESSDRCTSELKPDAIIHDGDIVFSWSGTLLVDMWCGGIGGINQHLFKVQSNKYPKWFYYMWTKYHLENFIHIAKDKAVTMGHIKRGHLENAIVNIPSSEALVALNKIFEPMLEQILKIRLENRKLREERDILLPRLMSGKLTC